MKFSAASTVAPEFRSSLEVTIVLWIDNMNSLVSPRLLAFVRSRIPMVEHDFALFPKETPAHAAQRVDSAKYSLSQAFFYAADLWVNRPPLVSEAALKYATDNWGPQAAKIWSLKRAEIPGLDRCKISKSGLIYEHVTTGWMFREFILGELARRQGVLDPYGVAKWLEENYQTAWVTRSEDKRLNEMSYKSRRGVSRAEALAKYGECDIRLCDRPGEYPETVLVGDSVLEDEIVEVIDHTGEDDGVQTTAQSVLTTGDYAAFFLALHDALSARGSEVSFNVNRARNDPYVKLKNFDLDGARAMLILDAPRGAKVRTPVLSLETETGTPEQEPATEEWATLRDSCAGPKWHISYGRAGGVAGALCRVKCQLADAFEVTDAQTRDLVAIQTAAEIDEWRRALCQ